MSTAAERYFANKLMRHCPCPSEQTACNVFANGRADGPVSFQRYFNPWTSYARTLQPHGPTWRRIRGRCNTVEPETEDEGDVGLPPLPLMSDMPTSPPSSPELFEPEQPAAPIEPETTEPKRRQLPRIPSQQEEEEEGTTAGFFDAMQRENEAARAEWSRRHSLATRAGIRRARERREPPPEWLYWDESQRPRSAATASSKKKKSKTGPRSKSQTKTKSKGRQKK